ncbi:MAG: transcriptional repressor [Woeseia sp.]|nr:transcriptional repressor [Woeseia sp.]MBT8096584.1 transcriptional repressor [Woeseia sp.]NNE59430.1 transcriptional repressor [Woeseia sp.]NNL54621.1 transcriptional repressor [Woeseia sp.]
MTRLPDIAAFPPPAHNHDGCVADALATAEELCRTRGLRFTAIRRRVLELVWESHKPIGAYDILDALNRAGKKAAPPTVYRALEFLIEADLVHRLDSLNAFVGCPDPSSSHTGQFLICRGCHSVAELDDADIDSLVRTKAGALGFSAVHQMLEIQGLCIACSETASESP